jgi:hypothetical protein
LYWGTDRMERNQGVAGDCGAAYGLTGGIAVAAETLPQEQTLFAVGSSSF